MNMMSPHESDGRDASLRSIKASTTSQSCEWEHVHGLLAQASGLAIDADAH